MTFFQHDLLLWGERLTFFAALWVIGLFVEHTARFVWCMVRGGFDD